MQQALHRRAARLKKAGQRVPKKQQMLMHVVHVSTDQRKVGKLDATLRRMCHVVCCHKSMFANLCCQLLDIHIHTVHLQVYIGDEHDVTRNGTRCVEECHAISRMRVVSCPS